MLPPDPRLAVGEKKKQRGTYSTRTSKHHLFRDSGTGGTIQTPV